MPRSRFVGICPFWYSLNSSVFVWLSGINLGDILCHYYFYSFLSSPSDFSLYIFCSLYNHPTDLRYSILSLSFFFFFAFQFWHFLLSYTQAERFFPQLCLFSTATKDIFHFVAVFLTSSISFHVSANIIHLFLHVVYFFTLVPLTY